MMLHLSALWSIAPRAVTTYVLAFADAEHVLTSFGIDSQRRVRHFLGQVLHESGGLTLEEENLNYSAKRLMAVWPSRFPTLESAKPYANHPKRLANKVYGGRLGNVDPDDGWTFRGRGLLQITGRKNYEHIGHLLEADFVMRPDLVLDPVHCLPVAAAIWRDHGCNEAADLDDGTEEGTEKALRRVTKLVNGGAIGLESRAAWLEKARAVVEELT